MVYTKLIKEPEFLCSKFKKAVFNKYIKHITYYIINKRTY